MRDKPCREPAAETEHALEAYFLCVLTRGHEVLVEFFSAF